MTKQKRAFARALSGGAFLGVLGLISASPARATDANMVQAPSATEQADQTNPLIVVRQPNGAAVCLIANRSTTWNCSTLGAPSGGVTTGPSVTIMPKIVAPPGVAFTFVFVRNGNNFYEKHLQLEGTGWTNWSTSMVGPPPSGVTPSSALVASHGNQTISVAFRDTQNHVWVKVAAAQPNDALPVFGAWIMAPADNTTSAPAPALGNSNTFVFALGQTNQIRFATCCFSAWSLMPADRQTFNEGVQTVSKTDQDTDFDTWVTTAATHSGSVYFETMDMTTGTEFGNGTGHLTSPQGKAADSAPAIVQNFSGDILGSLIIVHMNDQRWWTFDLNLGVWRQLPATP